MKWNTTFGPKTEAVCDAISQQCQSSFFFYRRRFFHIFSRCINTRNEIWTLKNSNSRLRGGKSSTKLFLPWKNMRNCYTKTDFSNIIDFCRISNSPNFNSIREFRPCRHSTPRRGNELNWIWNLVMREKFRDFSSQISLNVISCARRWKIVVILSDFDFDFFCSAHPQVSTITISVNSLQQQKTPTKTT